VMDDNPEGTRLIDRPGATGPFATGAAELERVVGEWAAVITAANARATKLWSAFEEAANTDADLAAAYEGEAAKMRADGRRGLQALVDAGLCPAPADPSRLVDLIWVAGHPRTYDLLVRQAGWASADVQRWLTSHWTGLLQSGGLS